jgi:glutathione S-transferase
LQIAAQVLEAAVADLEIVDGRVRVAGTDRSVSFIDLANKPAWFVAISPLGKTPVLRTGDTAIFESAVILEYLEETRPAPLHPADPLRRAEHRSWIEFGSATLNDIAGLYSAPDEQVFVAKSAALSAKFGQLEKRLADGPYFAGRGFSLVDAVYAPVFRYFDIFDRIGDFGILANKPAIGAWRRALAARPSVQTAVVNDYGPRLWAFLRARGSFLSALMPQTELGA